jgi:VIT1/CCC1 family predicted Fe2+/Mn2+ transporter
MSHFTRHLTKFSFGATSAIVTSLAFIVGLSRNTDSRLIIIGSLLVIAIADNISDSLGIHIYQESELKKPRAIRASTFYNFLTRFLATMVFVLLVAFLPTMYAVTVSIAYGVSLVVILSYLISKEQKVSPWAAILQHVAIVVLVIIASSFVGEWIAGIFRI